MTPKAVTLSEGSDPSVCPCGRSHSAPRQRRKAPGLADHSQLSAKIYDARASGKAEMGEALGEWNVNFAHNCERPIQLKRSASGGALFATYRVRCRTCPPCLRASMWRWLRSMEAHIAATASKGRRTWFGTLTLRPEAQQATLHQALVQWMQSHGSSGVPDWWDDPACDYRFALHRAVLVREIQLYWKRLRKAGHRFKYIVVFERHKSGLPHMHWLVHEAGDRITKDALQKQWHLGFTKVKLVCAEHNRKAAYYVSKYLSKNKQSRQLASLCYDTIKYPLKG